MAVSTQQIGYVKPAHVEFIFFCLLGRNSNEMKRVVRVMLWATGWLDVLDPFTCNRSLHVELQ